MTSEDQRILFTALGFLTVVLRNDGPQDKQAERALGIARLIEDFCATPESETFSNGRSFYCTSAVDAEQLAKDYIAELRATGAASLEFDRPTLLRMYEFLTIQKMRYEQESFYLLAQSDVIANNVLRLAEEQIERGIDA